MSPVGDTLRRTRLKRNLQLAEISNELKISTRILQAIEEDQYDKLPGGVFAKSFVRQYARLLGLDEEEIAGRMEQAMGPAEEGLPSAEGPRPTSVPPIQVPKVDEWETVGDTRFRWSGWLSAAVFVAVIVICSAIYAWMQRPKPVPVGKPVASLPAPTPAPPPAPSITAPAVTPAEPGATPPPAAGQPPAEQPAAEQKPVEQKPAEQKPAESTPAEPQPAAPAPAPAGYQQPPPNPDATVHVQIVADEAAWVLARADGKYLFSDTLAANATRTVEGVKDVVLKLGNAGGVTISLNGKPIGSIGPKGQIRTLQFTSGGFHIVPAKPPAVVLDDRL